MTTVAHIESTLGDEVLIVQCADCQCELIGLGNHESILAWAKYYECPILAGRIQDGERHAPYCSRCLAKHIPQHPLAVA